jgi:hypothetical protein
VNGSKGKNNTPIKSEGMSESETTTHQLRIRDGVKGKEQHTS